MTQLIVRMLLWVLPGLGSAAGPLGIFLGIFLSAEATLAYNIVEGLVHEADDPNAHPEWAGEGHGWDKFNWVGKNAIDQFGQKQIDIAKNTIVAFIAIAVGSLEAKKAT